MHDTMRYLKRLEAVGFTRQQAEAQVEIMSEGIRTSVATRNDLMELRNDFMELRNDFMQLRSEFANLRGEVKAEIVSVRSEFALVRAEMKQLENRMTIKLGGLMTAGISLIAILTRLH